MGGLHRAAASGFAAGADTYVLGRPDYPADVAGWLTGGLGLAPDKTAVDLGAGTGKFTPNLCATGARVIAVEPVAAMRAKLSARLPGVEVLEGTAAAIPLDDASVDAVVCAQSFHWFATREALAEIRRVLKPGGVLGLIWNVRDESVGWVAALQAITAPYEAGVPRFRDMAWRAPLPADGFGPLEERRFPHGHTGDPERVIVDRTLSVSFIAALTPDERDRVAARVRALIAATPELAGRGEVTFPYDTLVLSCRKAG